MNFTNEPFTQTSYWDRQELVIDDLPSSGTYFVVIFGRNIIGQDDNNNNNNSAVAGKYSLAIGEIEDFSPYDFSICLKRGLIPNSSSKTILRLL